MDEGSWYMLEFVKVFIFYLNFYKNFFWRYY